MVANTRQVVVGVFQDRDNAERAINDLHNAGFNDKQIGFVVRQGNRTEGNIAPANTTDVNAAPPSGGAVAGGVVAGGVIGGIIGAGAALLIPGIGPAVAGGILAATLGGAAIGAAAGGIIGALTSMGVPEEEARYYQGEFEQGRTLVTVQAGNRSQEAMDILRRNGAYDAGTRTTSTTTGTYTAPTYNTTTTTTTATNPNASNLSSTDWNSAAPTYRDYWQQRYGTSGGRWEDYEPGYRYGWEMANNPQYRGRDWATLEPEFRRNWQTTYPNLPWDQYGQTVRESWEYGRNNPAANVRDQNYTNMNQ